MESEFVKYEVALALKELWFDEFCFGFYSTSYYGDDIILIQKDVKGANHLVFKDVLAPLKQQVFRWFREKHGIYYYITSRLPHVTGGGYNTVIDDIWWPNLVRDTYEDAENALIDKLIEIAKEQDISQAEYDFIQSGS